MRRIGAILFLVLVLTMPGCLTLKQPGRKIEYYTLEYKTIPLELGPIDQPLSSVIRLERFDIAPVYNTDRIVFREQDFKRTNYSYHRWRRNPADLVTFFLGRDLRSSGWFRAVSTYNSTIPHTHRVEGAIDEFLEWDSDNGWNVVLSVDITLLDSRETDISKKVIFQKQFSTTKKCEEKHPTLVAQSMSLAMADISKEICLAIITTLSDK
ncbi:MAG: hypothetical protein GY941_02220 [Planctomycetes bacterium]|nr:hypothetical protein [Planctomycetota bacterium]